MLTVLPGIVEHLTTTTVGAVKAVAAAVAAIATQTVAASPRPR